MKIKNTETIHQSKIKLVIYGASGSGKTSSIKTLPHDRTLVISAESGLLALSGTNINYIDVTTDDNGSVLPPQKRMERLSKVLEYIQSEEARKSYDNIVVDSLTEIGELIAAAAKDKYKDQSKSFLLWGEIGENQIKLIKFLRDIPYYNVFILCLEELEKDEMSKRYYNVDLPGSAAKSFILPCFDMVFRLTVESDGRRYLQTQPLSTIKAKDRSGILSPQEPVDLGLILSKIYERERALDAKEKK